MAATVLVYSNTLGASFQFDDLSNIVQNEGLRDWRSLWPPSGNRYLGFLSFALNYRLGGGDVFGFHTANLVIHICNSLLVFWLTSLTLKTPALRGAETGPLLRRYLPLTAGLLFAVHPVQTQAVTYIVQRFTSLATLFYLLSVALFSKARLLLEADRSSKGRAASIYALSVIAAIAAMKTKEISFTIPLVAIGYELLFFRPGRRLLLLAPLAATAVLIPLGLATQGRSMAAVLGDVSHFPGEAAIPRSAYLLTQSRVVVTYLRLLLLPAWQNLDYDFHPSYSVADPSVLFALSVLLAVAALAVILLVRGRKTNRAAGILAFFGIAWFFITLSVESSVIVIRDVIFEHRIYLPTAGAAVSLGTALLWALEVVRSRISPGFPVAAGLLVTTGSLGVATYARNSVWHDPLTLWSDVVAKSPGKARARYNLGRSYVQVGRLDDAIREFHEALRRDPEYAEAHHNLGAANMEKGDAEGAAREYRAAIQVWTSTGRGHLDPRIAETHRSLGLVYEQTGQLDDAIREYREAIRMNPGFAEAYNDLGVAYAAKGEFDAAMRAFGETIRLEPLYPKPHENLCAIYGAKGQGEDAIRECRKAIRLDPAQAGAHDNLARALNDQGHGSEAVEEFRRAVMLKPLPETVFRLAGALESAGRSAEAIVEYQRFLAGVGQDFPDRDLVEKARLRLGRLQDSLAPPRAR
jgi:tetratricopeptide (TPR) repeat protein